MIKKEIYINSITETLALLCKEIEMFNCINFYDINIISEDFYAQLLNKIYGYSLYNLNSYQANAAAIDLVDDDKKLSYQVTSDNDSEKIKYTIDKFIENKLFLKYERLVILMLTKKKKYTTTFDTKNLFTFDKNKDIIDYTDLIKDIRNKDTITLGELCNFLESELNSKLHQLNTTQASEVQTIIELIEYITNNRVKNGYRDTVIDPEYKIKKRFKEFAERLENNYLALYPIYGETLKTVRTSLEIDEAQDIITTIYLQDISIEKLNEASNDPVNALQRLVIYFEKKLSLNGKVYDRAAIKFYLIDELIKCNVFPNERSNYNDDKK